LRLHAKEKDAKEKNAKKKDAKDAKDDVAEPEALACYGLLREDTKEMLLRFVEGRPISGVTIQFLEWVTTTLAQQGCRVLVLAWDNATWHVSGAVRQWIKAHNQRVKQRRRQNPEQALEAGCRLLICPLPVKSPWLNAIEPKWVHGKKQIVEPRRKLSGLEIQQRLCDYYKSQLLPRIVQ
jgi:hypothetical protein